MLAFSHSELGQDRISELVIGIFKRSAQRIHCLQRRKCHGVWCRKKPWISWWKSHLESNIKFNSGWDIMVFASWYANTCHMSCVLWKKGPMLWWCYRFKLTRWQHLLPNAMVAYNLTDRFDSTLNFEPLDIKCHNQMTFCTHMHMSKKIYILPASLQLKIATASAVIAIKTITWATSNRCWNKLRNGADIHCIRRGWWCSCANCLCWSLLQWLDTLTLLWWSNLIIKKRRFAANFKSN